jgi:drug/metabolite transporter (DMT)-like permease
MSGVLLILQPWGQGAFSMVAAAAAAVATVCYSLSALTVRSLGRRNTSMSMVFWYLALVGTGAGLLAINQWHAVESADWKWLAAVGVSGALGQLWLTEAFRHAPPSVVGPFEYTAMLWAFGIDWIFWSASPSAGLLIGAAIVVASGIVIILDERRLAELAVNPACSPP